MISQRGRADLEGCRPPWTSGSAMTSLWCQMSTPFNLSPPLISLCTFYFLFIWSRNIWIVSSMERQTNVTVDKRITGFYFTAFVYSRDLFSLSLFLSLFFFFFGRNKKSFSIPTLASVFDFSVTSQNRQFANLENLLRSGTWENLKVFKRQTAYLLVFNCSAAGVENLLSDCCIFTTEIPTLNHQTCSIVQLFHSSWIWLWLALLKLLIIPGENRLLVH